MRMLAKNDEHQLPANRESLSDANRPRNGSSYRDLLSDACLVVCIRYLWATNLISFGLDFAGKMV